MCISSSRPILCITIINEERDKNIYILLRFQSVTFDKSRFPFGYKYVLHFQELVCLILTCSETPFISYSLSFLCIYKFINNNSTFNDSQVMHDVLNHFHSIFHCKKNLFSYFLKLSVTKINSRVVLKTFSQSSLFVFYF